jgi:hypothetical protein
MEILLFLFCLLIILTISFLPSKSKISKKDINTCKVKWEKIMLNDNYNQAIIDADKLLSFVLKKNGYNGSVGEQLKKSKSIKNKNDIWYAHKVRNKIAHELDYEVNDNKIDKILNIYKKAIKQHGFKL